jgi:hypothetical protein
MKKTLIALAALVVCALPFVASADWDPCNPDPDTKFYQLPDPVGWDVKMTTPKILADDFVCIETGWITDIHFWGSWKGGVAGEITRIHLSIHSDIPAGEVGPDGYVYDYSRPGDPLWVRDLIVAEVPAGSVQIQDEVTGIQGWYDPNTGEYEEYDHSSMVQVNIFLDQIFPLCELFVQEGASGDPMIYWLDLQVDVDSPPGTVPIDVDFGWKTSTNHGAPDYAVWSDLYIDDAASPNPLVGWQVLLDPVTGEGLDMAFVITGIPIPEPGILVLSGLGLLALLARRRRK